MTPRNLVEYGCRFGQVVARGGERVSGREGWSHFDFSLNHPSLPEFDEPTNERLPADRIQRSSNFTKSKLSFSFK